MLRHLTKLTPSLKQNKIQLNGSKHFYRIMPACFNRETLPDLGLKGLDSYAYGSRNFPESNNNVSFFLSFIYIIGL